MGRLGLWKGLSKEWSHLADIHPRFPTSRKSGPKNSMEQTLYPHMETAQHTDKRHSPELTFKFLACPRPSPKDVHTCHVERLSRPGTPLSPRWSYWHRQTGSWSRWRPRTWTACAAAPCCPGAVTACPGSKSTVCRRWTLRSGCAHSASLPPSRNTQGAANTQKKKSLLLLYTEIRLCAHFDSLPLSRNTQGAANTQKKELAIRTTIM